MGSVAGKKKTLEFQAETRQLLDLMIHALYSNREIFLRELISNASDAADRLRFAALSDDSLYEDDAELKIRVEYSKENRTITVLDNGIGMSREEAEENLGTIARSGNKQFFASLSEDQRKNSELIGQFGVGFYSAFIVADKVEVHSRRAGLPRTQGVRWISTGESEFSIEGLDRPARGTKIVLHLRDDASEFLDYFRLRSIIVKYSDHISIPIIMPGEGEDKGEEQINKATALWRRAKKDLGDDDYETFYRHVAHDFDAPLAWLHNRVEGKLEYVSLLYIPGRAPFDLWDREQRHGIRLYVRRVFIMDDAEHLLPSWLRFVRGVVDCDDLPLNISREILQHNRTIEAIRAGCTRKMLSMLEKMAEQQAEKYRKFWDNFGRVLKEGVVEPNEYKDTLCRLFRFASTKGEGESQSVSLEDYVGRMPESQEHIYFIIADSYNTAANSPHLEIFRSRDMEVLLMSDPIDEWLVGHVEEYQGKRLVSVSKGELSLDGVDGEERDASASDEEKADSEETANTERHQKLNARIQEALGDRIKAVRVSSRLTDSPACLVTDENGMGRHMVQMLKAAGQSVPESKPTLEINLQHPLIQRLETHNDEERFREWCHILVDQALLGEGGQPEDLPAHVRRLNRLLVELSQ